MRHFLPLYPLTAQKIKTKKNNLKMPGDIIILHKCTKNYDQVMYGSWNMVCDRCNCYFSFWAIFYTFTPLKARKIKILKKWEKPLEISSFYICVPKIMIRWGTVPEIWCVTNKFSKIWKKAPRDIIILHICTRNYDQIM